MSSETIGEQIDEALLKKYQAQLAGIRAGTAAYETTDPEAVIFHKKQLMTKRLLEIPVEDLSKAPEQPWYGEYIALLGIRLENPALRFMGKQYVAELLQWYTEHAEEDIRYLATFGMIQFIDPLELTVPFTKHLWHKTLIEDVRAVFLNYYPSVNYSDDDIATYRLARQAKWRHPKRKMRVVFLVQSHVTCDKVLPVYEAMKQRDDIEPFLVVHARADYTYTGKAWAYFRNRYPGDMIYYSTTLMDMRRLRPDYVFITNPYEERRPFPSFVISDIVKYAKVCIISYGVSLIYSMANRLFNEYTSFYRNVYLFFASTETVKTLLLEKFPLNAAMNRHHFEFLGYPALKNYYKMKSEPSAVKRILWTPRWGYNSKIGGSHFLEYKDPFVALTQKYKGKVQLFFRPHMNLFKNLVRGGRITKEDVAAYKKTLRRNHITRHTNLADMDEGIRNIDIFLADYSSILICLFLTGRPIIYCEFTNAVIFPEFKEMFAAMYIAHTWEDVLHYLDELLAGNDPMFEKRQAIAEKIYEKHKDATAKIVERMIQDFESSQLNDAKL